MTTAPLRTWTLVLSWWVSDNDNDERMRAMEKQERLVVIIERDDDHMQHVWFDVGRGWQDEEAAREEAENLSNGTWSVYGVTTAKVCVCCDQVTEPYVTALWGCVVEASNQEGRYEVGNLGRIEDDYLREVAREVVEEAKVS